MIFEKKIGSDEIKLKFNNIIDWLKRTALLGLYNGQGLVENETEYLMRITPNDEFVKIVVYKNKGLVQFN